LRRQWWFPGSRAVEGSQHTTWRERGRFVRHVIR
jgi:hypothetical protein